MHSERERESPLLSLWRGMCVVRAQSVQTCRSAASKQLVLFLFELHLVLVPTLSQSHATQQLRCERDRGARRAACATMIAMRRRNARKCATPSVEPRHPSYRVLLESLSEEQLAVAHLLVVGRLELPVCYQSAAVHHGARGGPLKDGDLPTRAARSVGVRAAFQHAGSAGSAGAWSGPE
jgi:hypothetical protein